MSFYIFAAEFGRGPPLHEVPLPLSESIVYSAVNFISLKVCKLDVGFPINVFGTVIARDHTDYRCVYIFKRETDDFQTITSPVRRKRFLPPYHGPVATLPLNFYLVTKIHCILEVSR
jgi:hypothetical protein